MLQLVNVLLGRFYKVVGLFFSSKSASCTHVSGLLHALASIAPCTIGDSGGISSDE